MNIINDWFKRFLSDRQMIILTVLLLTGLLAVLFAGRYLTPVIASLIVAYLLEGIIHNMQRLNIPRMVAVSAVFTLFFMLMLALLLLLMPLLVRQATQLLQEVPQMLIEGQRLVLTLPEKYPTIFSEIDIENYLNQIRREAVNLTDAMLRQTLSSVIGIITLVVYIVLVPLLVFFFLKDKTVILEWARSYLPKERGLASGVWKEVDAQLGNFIRGKFWEILLVGSASYVTFVFMGLNFAVLLGFLVGVSVLVPYLGAVVVTFPVALVAYVQFGWSSDLAWIIIAYGIIQLLDGNVLVPILFSEAVNLHPIAIIVAVLFFGGVWGFWGVFFAIPLAILLQSVLKAWTRQTEQKLAG
ncbi:MAG: AI-2E family transporter [Desulfocapsaceae bacterium]|nr:AI-2E family transporter [Desulfocapsaceae bacterium]